VGGADEGRRVVDVEVGRRDVHVTRDQQPRGLELVDPGGDRIEERELARELRAVESPPVGRVDAREANSVD